MVRPVKKGFSLVEMMVVLGALGGMALVVMQLSKNSSSMQSEVVASSEFNDLKSEVDIILNGENDCTASFKGVSFKANSINSTPIAVELWNGDQNSSRTRKRFSSTDPEASKSGKSVIESIHLQMPDYTSESNFPAGVKSTFKGEVVLRVQKPTLPKAKVFPDIRKSVYMTFNTAEDGTSTIESCGPNAGGKGVRVIASGAGHDGESGETACKSVGAECSYVESNNYMTDVIACPNLGTCIQTCMTYYNNSLPGVVNTNGHDNVHSCEARIGNFVTYADPLVVRCSAYFRAICNNK